MLTFSLFLRVLAHKRLVRGEAFPDFPNLIYAERRARFEQSRLTGREGTLTPENMPGSGDPVFSPEADRILLAGIHLGRDGQSKALRQVQEIMPALSVESIDVRMQRIAADGLPAWVKADEFWTPEMDNVLRRGIQQGGVGERIAVAKILRLCPGLRTAVVWRRVTRLRQSISDSQRRRGRLSWTEAADGLLLRTEQVGGFESAVGEVQRLTGFPREAIMRRARKLGVYVGHSAASTPWTDADVRFLLESVQHLSVKVIARELHRTEKAVWRKVGELGLSAKCEEGYTVTEIIQKLHVWHRRLKGWVANGWIKIGRNRRITERSLRSFLREHPEELKWDLFDSETVEWLLEFGVTAPAAKARATSPVG